ncbi:hypothetical protein CFC21_054125 [Triticum aestivum]|uniref:Uncharacterized protein n=2 Tax=Triticum aestivum TaxID=4565 RepID=A0A3B6HZ00_WHEAT|nr:ankyrin-3-like isoform X1 [Triticum aestivum]KAF7044970.1 hypothetical protein CFC21_054125 [Triticum aestivum]
MAPPPTSAAGLQQRRLLKAAADGDLGRFKSIASALDGGKGRVREAVEAARDGGSGPLHAAARHGRMPVCVYLVEQLGVNVDAADDKGDTPLMYALGWGNLDTVRYLLDHDADPEKRGEHGMTALHVAAGAGMCEMIEVLLSKGADVNSVSFCGTPLHAAITGKHDAAVKTLLDHHADCNKAMAIHYTPLIAAIHVRSLKCVKLLIKAGADVKGVGPLTPLIAAADDGLTDFYKPLLVAGADPNVRDDGDQLPIEIAARNNRRKDVEILFPVTSRIPYVHDWSVDGILAYVKSVPKEEDDPLYKMGPAYLKSEGNKAYKRKDYVSAINFYNMATKLDPEDVALHSNRSVCWINLGEGDKALEAAEMCRMIRPDWPKACYRQGAAQMFFKGGIQLDEDISCQNGLMNRHPLIRRDLPKAKLFLCVLPLRCLKTLS